MNIFDQIPLLLPLAEFAELAEPRLSLLLSTSDALLPLLLIFLLLLLLLLVVMVEPRNVVGYWVVEDDDEEYALPFVSNFVDDVADADSFALALLLSVTWWLSSVCWIAIGEIHSFGMKRSINGTNVAM